MIFIVCLELGIVHLFFSSLEAAGPCLVRDNVAALGMSHSGPAGVG